MEFRAKEMKALFFSSYITLQTVWLPENSSAKTHWLLWEMLMKLLLSSLLFPLAVT